MLRKLILIVALQMAVASAVLAQSAPASYPGTPQEQAACRNDAMRHCRGISDPSEVRDCLVSHRARLAGRCRRVLERHGY
ncbi:MAG TPA: hypothetical protein VK456_09555 [Xanthobacteraceae bacterium]|nr:hypothetical protein [Xanthobacteraceae bacterium]